MSWQYLSYPLNDKAFGYGNGQRFQLTQERSIQKGDTSNNSSFCMPSHFGTHIDFPFHFDQQGKTFSNYQAGEFIFEHPCLIELSNQHLINDYLIRNVNLDVAKINSSCDILIIKTGFCERRNADEYWNFGLGFHVETADFLKTHLPNLRAIAFDLISLNSYQQREMGREAHMAFLIKNSVLIVEDVDLRNVNLKTVFGKLFIGVLPIEFADGAPCTILAEVKDEN